MGRETARTFKVMPTMQIIFLVVCGVAVLVVVMGWLPFRSGRRVLAIYDQVSAYAIIGVLSAFSATSEKVEGFSLWVPGLAGLLFGISAYVLVDALCRRYKDWEMPRGALFLIGWYVGRFIISLMSTLAGVFVGRLAYPA